jgi:formylmethanofuran dehydrogenase subunit A
MSPAETNARVVLPVTTFDTINRGYPVDFVLYANNYEAVDEKNPVIERFENAETALQVFRQGAVMSKGTTTTTGKVSTYFANVFGPQQYQDIHEAIASRFFQAFYERNVFVGQMRTQLGINGCEQSGPEQAARMLLKLVGSSKQRD